MPVPSASPSGSLPMPAGPRLRARGVIEVLCRRSGCMGGEGLRRLAGYLGGNWDPGRLGGPGVRGAVAV